MQSDFMSELNEESIKHLSHLCRIEVDEKDIPLMLNHLKQILDYAAELQEVNVFQLTPYPHLEPQEVSFFREDVTQDILPREEFLKNAPDSIGGMIRIPPVMQK